MIITEEVYLEHFGIKGMRWGIITKKYSDDNPRSSKELVKQAKAHSKVALRPSIDARMDRVFLKEPIKYSELSNKSVTIKKGTEFYRTTQRKDEKLSDMTYASYTKEDRIRYQAVMSAVRSFGYAKRAYKPTYEAVYKSTTALRSPSEKERFDAFVNLMDAKVIPVGWTSKKKDITGRQYLLNIGYDPQIKKMDKQVIGERFYNDFVSMQYAKAPINTVYFNSLRKKGYNAVIDDNDRRILSDEPIMIINTSTNTIKQMSVRRLSNDELNIARTKYPPIKIPPKEKTK